MTAGSERTPAGNGASYVLMNPLSAMGRGVKSNGKLSSGEEHMRRSGR